MTDTTDPARVAAEKIVRLLSVVCNVHVNDILPDIREACAAPKAEVERLRAWLRWMAVDDTDAQAALRGEPARMPDDQIAAVDRITERGNLVALILSDHGIAVTPPDEATLDNVERERWEVCVKIAEALQPTTNPLRKVRCRECRGTGYAEPAPCFTFGNDCPVCHGSGWLLPSQLPTHSDADFSAGYEAGKRDAIDRCCVEKIGKEWPDQRTHNVAVNLCIAAIRALDVRHAVEKWKTP